MSCARLLYMSRTMVRRPQYLDRRFLRHVTIRKTKTRTLEIEKEEDVQDALASPEQAGELGTTQEPSDIASTPVDDQLSDLKPVTFEKHVPEEMHPNDIRHSKDRQCELVRDYIHRQLYESDGFFNSAEAKGVGSRVFCPPDIKFEELVGETDYRRKQMEFYEMNDTAFLTPCELFKPHYGQGVVRWMLAARKSIKNPFRILEIGGGNGSFALNVLDYLEEHHPDEYNLCTYTIVDLSKNFCEVQQQRLAKHKGKFKNYNMSICDWDDKVEEECFIIGLEVLDNMPHDKVCIVKNQWRQCEVAYRDGDIYELENEINDTMIYETLHLYWAFEQSRKEEAQYPWTKAGRKQFRDRITRLLSGHVWDKCNDIYLPTTCLYFLRVLRDYFPNHHLFLSDVEFLPDTCMGKWAPLVYERGPATKGKRLLHNDYIIDNSSSVDIYFPVSFDFLKYMYEQTCEGRRGEVQRNSDFMLKYCPDISRTECRNGYNPSLEDCINVYAFMTEPNNPIDDPVRW